jgi:hypothetical protein
VHSLSLQGAAAIDVDHIDVDHDVGCPIGMTGRTTSSPDCTKATERPRAVFVLDEVIALGLAVGGSTDVDAGVDPHTRAPNGVRRYQVLPTPTWRLGAGITAH